MNIIDTIVKRLAEWTILAVFLVGWWAMIGYAFSIVHPYMFRQFSELEALAPVIVNGAMILTFFTFEVFIPLMSMRESGPEAGYA